MAQVGVLPGVSVDAHGRNSCRTAGGVGAVGVAMQQSLELAVALEGVEDWCCC